jgi:hypothetical protein
MSEGRGEMPPALTHAPLVGSGSCASPSRGNKKGTHIAWVPFLLPRLLLRKDENVVVRVLLGSNPRLGGSLSLSG